MIHYVDASLAVEYGVGISALLTNTVDLFKEKKVLTLKEIEEIFPYISSYKLKKSLNRLIELGIFQLSSFTKKGKKSYFLTKKGHIITKDI